MVWWLHYELLLLSLSSSPPFSQHCKWTLLFMRLSLCVPLPAPVVDTGHLRWAWSRQQLDSKSSVFNECELILQQWRPWFSCIKAATMISHTVSPGKFTDVLSPPLALAWILCTSTALYCLVTYVHLMYHLGFIFKLISFVPWALLWIQVDTPKHILLSACLPFFFHKSFIYT